MSESKTSGAPADPHRGRRLAYKGISAGTFFICIGVVLLLNTLGQVEWGVWADLARLWPILLVSLGIRMIFARTPLHVLSLIGPILVACATVWAVTTHEERGGWELVETGSESVECPAPQEGEAVRLHVRDSGGEFRLIAENAARSDPPAGGVVPASGRQARGAAERPGAAAGFHGTVRYEDRKPLLACNSAGDLRLGRRGWGERDLHVAWPFRGGGRRWEARLGSAAPVDLDLSLAAVSAELDLRAFSLRDVDLDVHAATIEMRLGAPRGRVPIRIDGAVTRLELSLPEGTCYTVSRDRALSLLDAGELQRSAGRRSERLTSAACAPGGEASGKDEPRYEIHYTLPLSSVSIQTRRAGA